MGRELGAIGLTIAAAHGVSPTRLARALLSRRMTIINDPYDSQRLIGQVIDRRYRILGRIGRGGMGGVFLAQHLALGRRCALKILLPEHSSRSDIERFLREARMVSAIEHPNVVKIYDTGLLDDGRGYYAMEFLSGEDLATTLEREGRLPWLRVRHLLLHLCSGLTAVHGLGIVHRDLKPHNFVRTHTRGDDDFLKILDFGIAKGVHGELVSHSLTQSGQILGTPCYMAPEQLDGGDVDARIDIFALGVITYQLLTGQLPFRGETLMQLFASILTREPEPIRAAAPGAEIPDFVESVVLRALSKNPAARFPSAAEFAAALAQRPVVLAGSRAASQPPRPAAPAAAEAVSEDADTAPREREVSGDENTRAVPREAAEVPADDLSEGTDTRGSELASMRTTQRPLAASSGVEGALGEQADPVLAVASPGAGNTVLAVADPGTRVRGDVIESISWSRPSPAIEPIRRRSRSRLVWLAGILAVAGVAAAMVRGGDRGGEPARSEVVAVAPSTPADAGTTGVMTPVTTGDLETSTGDEDAGESGGESATTAAEAQPVVDDDTAAENIAEAAAAPTHDDVRKALDRARKTMRRECSATIGIEKKIEVKIRVRASDGRLVEHELLTDLPPRLQACVTDVLERTKFPRRFAGGDYIQVRERFVLGGT